MAIGRYTTFGNLDVIDSSSCGTSIEDPFARKQLLFRTDLLKATKLTLPDGPSEG